MSQRSSSVVTSTVRPSGRAVSFFSTFFPGAPMMRRRTRCLVSPLSVAGFLLALTGCAGGGYPDPDVPVTSTGHAAEYPSGAPVLSPSPLADSPSSSPVVPGSASLQASSLPFTLLPVPDGISGSGARLIFRAEEVSPAAPAPDPLPAAAQAAAVTEPLPAPAASPPSEPLQPQHALAASTRALPDDLPTVACDAPLSRPPGYNGPSLPAGTALQQVTIQPNVSWWVYARRHALDYPLLAALNGLPLLRVRSGSGLVAGESVWLIARTGLARRGRQAVCAPDGVAPNPPTLAWTLFPENIPYRFPADASARDPDLSPFLWGERSQLARVRARSTWASLSRRYGHSVSDLLAFNGVDATRVSPQDRVTNHVGIPLVR